MPLTKIQSLGITDGTIVNADINASAAIAGTKISGSFGKVLQVVQGTNTTATTTTSASFVTTNITASITPSSPFKITVILLFADGFGFVFSPDFGKFSISAALSLPDIC
jgi:hypothetical protein